MVYASGGICYSEPVLARNRFALKEWATVCEKVGRGDLVLLVRKGGIRERRGGFEMEHREFFLFPTRFHETGDTPEAQVTLDLYAQVEEDVWIRDLEVLRRLDGQHGVPWKDVEHRFHYGREPGVHVLALRAFRLARPHVLHDALAYDGCRSWVELDRELPVEHEGPILNRSDFRRRLEALQAVVDG